MLGKGTGRILKGSQAVGEVLHSVNALIFLMLRQFMCEQGSYRRLHPEVCQRSLAYLTGLTRLRVPEQVHAYWPTEAASQALPLLRTYAVADSYLDAWVRRACWSAEEDVMDSSLDWFCPEQKLRVSGYAALQS